MSRRTLVAGSISLALVGATYAVGLGIRVVAGTAPEVSTQPRTPAQARRTLARLGLLESYPFENGFVQTPHGRMHYAEAGSGPPILCIHGNPTWSFLYRKFLAGLSGSHRVVALDLIGFGLSEKPPHPESYTAEGHVADVVALIDALDLRDLTLVVQDWGGPIGIGAAAQRPERVRAIVAMNTWAFAPDPDAPASLPLPLRVLRVPVVGEELVQGLAIFNRVFVPLAIARPERRTPEVRRAYDRVQGSWEERAGTLAFPRMIPTSVHHPAARQLERDDAYLASFRGRVLLAWGMKDRAFSPQVLATWRKRFPHAPVLELPDAGHYLQEDAPERLVPWLARELSSS